MTTEEKLIRAAGRPPPLKKQSKARRVEIAKAGAAGRLKAIHAPAEIDLVPLPALVAAREWLEKHREELANGSES